MFQGYTGGAGAPARRIHHQHQAIIPSYKFNCCGNITEWGVDLNPDNGGGTFNFILQIWRPDSAATDTSGCHSLVDDYSSKSISLQNDAINMGKIARVTPSLQDQLQFQKGDVLGFYVESNGAGSDYDNGVVTLNDSNHTSELVWHASVNISAQASQSGSCPYPVGTNGVLRSSTHAAPVISIAMTTYPCSPITTHWPTPTVYFQMIEPGNNSITSVVSNKHLILGVSISILALLVIITFAAIIIAAAIVRHKSSQNSVTTTERYELSKEQARPREELYVYNYYPAVNTAHSVQLQSNIAYASFTK